MAFRNIVLEIRRGSGQRDKYIYAHIFDFQSGELLVSADLEYCLETCKERNYEIMNSTQAMMDLNTILRGMM